MSEETMLKLLTKSIELKLVPKYGTFNEIAEHRTKLRELIGVYLSAESQWIPCAERLPSESGHYIVTVEDFFNDSFFTSIVVFDGKIFKDEYYEVIAWMPLPKAYQPED